MQLLLCLYVSTLNYLHIDPKLYPYQPWIVYTIVTPVVLRNASIMPSLHLLAMFTLSSLSFCDVDDLRSSAKTARFIISAVSINVVEPLDSNLIVKTVLLDYNRGVLE